MSLIGVPSVIVLLLLGASAGCELHQDGDTVGANPDETHAQTLARGPVPGGHLVLSGTKPGVRLDPHMEAQWEVLYILSAVYDTLLYQDADGGLVPGLASEWEVQNDGTTYTFQLRKNVRFHDGTPFDAEAVKFNFERIFSLGPQSLKARTLLPEFKFINLPDEYTITIDLAHPDSYFLYSLTLPYLAMVSPAAVQTWGDEYHHHQSGTGPFKFTEYVVGDHYTLERNPDYWWAPSIYSHNGPAYLKNISWRFLSEPSTRAPALEAGDVDVAFDLLPTDAEHILASPAHTVSRAYLTGQPAFWFINTTLPPTDDIRVRQAILYGSDMKTAVATIMRGFNPVAHGPLSAVTPEYTEELEDLYPYDPERAKALLTGAGWVDLDGDGIREKNGEPLIILMSMVSWGQSPSFSELLYSQLQGLGITLRLEMMDYSVQMDFGRQGTKNMLFMGGSGHSASDSLRGYFHSANTATGFAWSKYRDPTLDALLDEAVSTLDLDARTELYRQVQRLIMEQALILPIYDYVLLVGVNRRVKGLRWGNAGLVPSFHDMYVADAALDQQTP